MDASCEYTTLGLAAVRIGVQYQHLHRLANGEKIPHIKAGRLRLVAVADLPAIRAVCEGLGYAAPRAEAVAHAV